MTSTPIHLGLDYHKSVVQVCVMDSAGQIPANRDCPNYWEAIARPAAGYGQVAGVAMEACTGAASLADELAGHAGARNESFRSKGLNDDLTCNGSS